MNDLYKSLLTAAATLIVGSVLSVIVSNLAGKTLGTLANRTKTTTDDFIFEVFVSTLRPLGLVISASLAWAILPIGKDLDAIVLGIAKLFVLVLLVRLSNKVIIRLIQRWSIKINDEAFSSMLKSLSPMVRALIWSIGSVFYLQNMGVQMAALWALLSAGGIGAGLALKEPVQEFFDYITILLDKPFQSGQFINIGDIWATVERVGVRSTRLRSINGEIVVMSNSALTNGIISNYTEMNSRRLVHKLGVVYDTNVTKLSLIPQIIKTIVDSTNDATFDRCHFTEFGNCSLDFEVVYYIPSSNYRLAMAAQQNINLQIMRRFEEEEIEFAFPTQTINLSKT